MNRTLMLALGAFLFHLPAEAQEAQVLHERNLSFGLAREIAETALSTCQKEGSKIAITVLDKAGVVRVTFKDDGAAPHTVENSLRKAYSALTFEAPSANFAKRLDEAPGKVAQVHLSNVIALAGGVPIMVGQEVIGAIGISGSKPGSDRMPGGTRDEACARAGVEKVATRLR